MPVRKPQEQSFHFHAATYPKKDLKPSWTQVAQSFHQHVGLMKRLPLWHFIQQFEDCTLRCRDRQRPFPLPPRLLHGAALLKVLGAVAGFPEQLLRVVKYESAVEFQFEDPPWRLAGAVQVDFARVPSREIVGKSLQFERSPTPDRVRMAEQCLQRYDDWLPAQALLASFSGPR